MVRGEQAARFLALVSAAFARGSTVHFRALGRSMAPTVEDGALVAIAAVDGAGVGPGDVVLCLVSGGGLVLHRIVGVGQGATLFVRGDAPTAEPDRIARAAVLARALGVVERGRLRPVDEPGVRLRVMARRAVYLVRRTVLGRRGDRVQR